jgi:two-component system phosphate regulon response regulator PhoB
MAHRILIVEDEIGLATTLSMSLQVDSYAVTTVHNGRDALVQLFHGEVPDLVVLDLLLPDLHGEEICRRIRAHGTTAHVPVMMLSARGEEKDRISGFEAGTDDFMAKPFNLREFKLRIRAILRRCSAPHPAAEPVLLVGELRLDTGAHRAWVGSTELELTALEFKLLTTLMQRQGRVQSRQQLLQDVWQYNAGVTTRTVDTHVRRLRRKLLTSRDKLETVRGVGYRFQNHAGR